MKLAYLGFKGVTSDRFQDEEMSIKIWLVNLGLIRFSKSDKTLPATSNALVVRHLVIYQTTSDVVLGFIWWAIGHPPKDDPDPIAGVTGWALSLHESKLLRVTDKWEYRS
jgi:hypothetical protein